MQEGDLNGGGYGEGARQEEASESPSDNALVVARIPEQPQYSSPERGQQVSQPSFNPLVSPQSQAPISRPGGHGHNTHAPGVVGEGSLAGVSAPVYMAHPGETLCTFSLAVCILSFH